MFDPDGKHSGNMNNVEFVKINRKDIPDLQSRATATVM